MRKLDRFGHIYLREFRPFQNAGGCTNLRNFGLTPTSRGGTHRPGYVVAVVRVGGGDLRYNRLEVLTVVTGQRPKQPDLAEAVPKNGVFLSRVRNFTPSHGLMGLAPLMN